MSENTKYKVVISDKAKTMLALHVRFMAQVNKEAAKSKKKQLIDSIRSLDKMPHRFPFFTESYVPENKYHKMFVEKWYLILFQIKDDIVHVEYIIDCRQDYNWLIR